MTYQEEEAKPVRQDSKHAITLAMQGRWREAVTVNKSLIENFPGDVGAYNRLGRAYMELGEYSEARDAYSRAVELDPTNNIAKKNLQRLSHLGEAAVGSEGDSDTIEPQHFIEEVGKAGVVNLHHLAPPQVLVRMVAGDKLYLRIDGSRLVVENSRGEFLGQVGPKQGQRLIKLMQGGNKYTAGIISAAENRISVIVREVYQDPSQSGRLSFPPRRVEGIHPYVNDRLLRYELEYEEEVPEEPGYTIVGGDETELLPDESANDSDENENNDE